MNSISHVLKLHPQRLTAADIVDQVASHHLEGRPAVVADSPNTDEYGVVLQDQYEDQVIALVIRDLTSANPAASVGAVNAVVAKVWEQAAEHVEWAATTWTHISWFVQNAVTEFIEGLRPQMAGC
ncbi:hypothetical protein ACFC1R_31185 [Kitasatospora sp. NPDC056138]|uniref:hypothetical protein n=1 Tax=Kitasatospora sp. NPDC056138 TaxID=3345724 RepID=UPI0035E2FA4A